MTWKLLRMNRTSKSDVLPITFAEGMLSPPICQALGSNVPPPSPPLPPPPPPAISNSFAVTRRLMFQFPEGDGASGFDAVSGSHFDEDVKARNECHAVRETKLSLTPNIGYINPTVGGRPSTPPKAPELLPL